MNFRLLLCILFWLQSSFIHAAVDKQLLYDLDLKRELFSDEYSSLSVAEQEMLVIINENTNAIARGVALLLTDNGITATSQQGLAPLIKPLRALGWVTMLLPTPPSDLYQPAETIVAPANETDSPFMPVKASASHINQQIIEEHLQRITLLMEAALAKAKEYSGFVLVIAQGTSAATLSQLYAEKTLTAPDAMVVINPYWPDRQYNKQLAAIIASTPMPILDIYSKWENGWSQASIHDRKVAATRALKLHYRQREIIGVGLLQQPASYVGKEIYGWLSHMGW